MIWQHRSVLDEIDWGSLEHAHGPATDTPGHLRGLVDGDVTAIAAADRHLHGAVVHQGFPTEVAPPACRYLAPRLPDLTGEARRAVLDFLAAVATGTGWAEKNTRKGHGDVLGELLGDLQAAVRETYPAVFALVDHPDRDVRRRAAVVALRYLATSALAGQRPALADRLRPWLDDPGENRARWVWRLGKAGVDVWRHRDDPDPATRVAVVLAAAFPYARHRDDGLTAAQRSVVADLVAAEDLWDPDDQVSEVFSWAGLPHDREACRRLTDRE